MHLLRYGLILFLVALLSGSAPPLGIWRASLNIHLMGLMMHEEFSVDIRETEFRFTKAGLPPSLPNLHVYSLAEHLPGRHSGEGVLLLRSEGGAYSLVTYRRLDDQHLQLDLSQLEKPLPEKSLAYTSLAGLDFDSETVQVMYHQNEYQRLLALPVPRSFSPAETGALQQQLEALSETEPYKSRYKKASHSTMGMLAGIYLNNELIQRCLIEKGYEPFSITTYQALIRAFQNQPKTSRE